MKVLWQEGEATASQIYTQVDSLGMTAKDLDLMLENMAARGWLDRKLISPQNEFTAFGMLKVEMSRKNAKNREYNYKPAVKRRDMFTFFEASVFSRRLRRAPGDDLIAAHLRKLIAILAADEVSGKN
jgi:predicted transcriptional regulator